MLVRLCLIVAALVVLPHCEPDHRAMPDYIRKALFRKNHPPPQFRRDKTRTLKNLTLHEIFYKIKDITRELNKNAMRNGYKVEYKFRMLDPKGK